MSGRVLAVFEGTELPFSAIAPNCISATHLSTKEQPISGPREGELILYQTATGAIRVEVLYEADTFWLNQKRIAELFGIELPTASYHLKEIYESGELAPEATLRKIRRVQREGNRDVSPVRSNSTTWMRSSRLVNDLGEILIKPTRP